MGVDSYYKGQKYDKLKKDQLKSRQLFHDPEFPPIQKSLFHTHTDDEIVWKRPTDLCNVPKFVVDGATSDDLIEGELGNRWFIAACAAFANQKQLFQNVVVDAASQEFGLSSYTGMFKFQFWLFGNWTEVVIDDFLPTRHGKLMYCHSKSKNEFWSALLEKAYAKLFGDYERLTAGSAVDAIVDFTGGVAERLKLSDEIAEDEGSHMFIFETLQKALQNNAFIIAEVRVQEEKAEEGNANTGLQDGTDVLVLDSPAKESAPSTGQSGGDGAAPKTGYFRSGSIVRDGFAMDCGLLRSHGYIIREVQTVTIRKEPALHLIRIQSPWQSGEWRGAWSNSSAEMKALSRSEKQKLGLKYETESDFWMLVCDFIVNFTDFDICQIPDDGSLLRRRTWHEFILPGEWVQEDFWDRRGGDISHQTFFMNPQYIFDVSDSMIGAVMVSLEQNDRTVKRVGRKEATNLCIGFTIMKVEENRIFRLHRAGDVVATSEFTENRSVFHKTAMPKGRYVIVPSTKNPGCDGEFLLRIYNSTNNDVTELIKSEPVKGMCSSGYSMAVQLTIVKAEGLSIEKGDLNPFCIVKCEGETQRTAVINLADSPTWNNKYIFYKTTTEGHKKYPITFQVMSSKTIGSTLLGETSLTDLGDEEGKTMELSLYQYSKKKDQPDVKLPGVLHIKVYSSDNLSAF